jgi:glutamate N-acetyltransferase/amino-acid N-acetyltransferase
MFTGLVQAIGKYVGAHAPDTDLSRLRLTLGGTEIFADGVFQLNPEKETALVSHLRGAELYPSVPPKDGVFTAGVDYPPHERCVEITVEFGSGTGAATIIGGDLTHEYVSENADYRS